MRDNDALMTRAQRLNPVAPDAFDGLAESADGQETLRAILASATRDEATEAIPHETPNLHRLRLRALTKRTAALGAAAALVLGIVTFGTSDRPTERNDSIWAADLVSFAEGSPRLLLGARGWTVVAADEFSMDTGEMMFATSPAALDAGTEPGEYWMSLNWYPSKLHDGYVKDRRRGADATWNITIDGQEAIVFRHNGTAPIGVTYYALWQDGGYSLELRTDVIPEVDDFKSVVTSAKSVDVDTWLSAMPASVVTPEERGDAVDRILSDIPVPSNVDLEALKSRGTVNNGLKYEVTDAILCGWIEQWIDADQSGNAAAKDDAVEAVSGARQWDALQNPGQYESFVFDVADAMAADAPVNDDRSVPIGVTYQRHLGCPEH